MYSFNCSVLFKPGFYARARAYKPRKKLNTSRELHVRRPKIDQANEDCTHRSVAACSRAKCDDRAYD